MELVKSYIIKQITLFSYSKLSKLHTQLLCMLYIIVIQIIFVTDLLQHTHEL